MAKKPEAESEETDKVKSSQTITLISAAALKKLLKADDAAKEEIDGCVGELRETIGNAVEKHHLDKAAYATLKKLHRMKSNEKLANFWDTLLAYMDMAGVMKRIESVTPLPLDGQQAEGEAEAEDGDGDKVARPAFGGAAAQH